MRWRSEWWGTMLVAENEDDKQMLSMLMGKLPLKPREDETYEGGEMEMKTGKEMLEETDLFPEPKEDELYLVFHR